MRETIRPGLHPRRKLDLVSISTGRLNSVAKTVNKHIRIEVTLWERLEAAARDRETTANRLLAELATQWLRNREWPATDVQLQVARSSLFTAQAMVRSLIAENRENEIEEIRRYISTILPDVPLDSPTANERNAQTFDPEQDCS